MEDFLQGNVNEYIRLAELYNETIHDSLKEPCENISELLIKLLDVKSTEYSLITNNSVYPTKYYQIKTRIKKKESFYEKLIRKNLGLGIVKKFNLLTDVELLNKYRSEIVSEIQRFDDLIGIRIVTELKKDCSNVYQLLQNSAEFFEANSIVFFDLEDQPQKMQNGLDIYRIKGSFHGLYYFELQIKSKIDEAWGDMDHSIFYKDYSVSPIKDTVQVTMNNVGILLEKIEKLLYDLRESGGSYFENVEHLKFQELLESEVAPLLKEKFKIPFKLKEISSLLRFFKVKAGNGEQKLETVNFDHLNWTVSDTFCLKFIEVRNTDYKLIVIEAIYLNWKGLFNKDHVSNEYTYEQALIEYLDYLMEFIGNEIEEDVKYVRKYMMEILPYLSTPDIFLSLDKIKESNLISKRIENIVGDDEKLIDSLIELQNSFRVILFKGKALEYLREVKGQKDISEGILLVRQSVQANNNQLDKIIEIAATQALDVLKRIE